MYEKEEIKHLDYSLPGDINAYDFSVLSGMNAKTPKCNFYPQELYNSSMQNKAIQYFSAKVSSLRISEKLQFANSMSAAYNRAVLRDKHGKVNGQLPVQILHLKYSAEISLQP